MSGGRHPYGPGDLADYLLGEMPHQRSDALEEHLFECPACAAELDAIDRVGVAVREAVGDAAVGANVTGAFLERALANGLTLREYRLEPGQTVACSAGPEDLFVVRLSANFAEAADLSLSVTFRDLERGRSQPLDPRTVRVDRESGDVLLVFPGSAVRAYPRSLWSLTIEGDAAGRRTSYGPFVMDHSP